VPASNGPLDIFLSSMTIGHNDTSFTMTTTDTAAVTCNYTAGYSQTGKFGLMNGTYSCSDGRSGPFQATELEANTNGFMGRFVYSYPACTWTGSIAAARP
jgi:hypothetical protein